jgi:hypothetical protein
MRRGPRFERFLETRPLDTLVLVRQLEKVFRPEGQIGVLLSFYVCFLHQFQFNGGSMSEIQEEERHLVEANQHITDAEGRISLQQERVGRAQGPEEIAETSQSLLSTMLASLDVMKMHREQILSKLADLKKFSPAEHPPHLKE